MTLSRQDTSIGFPPELESFRQLILSLDDKQWAAPSRCSGWTVADVAAHVVGTMADVANGQLEGLGSPEVTEREVAERRGRSRQEIADELEGVTKVAEDMLAAFDETAWQQPSPGGYDGTLGQGVEALYYDTWLHADDIRAPLGQTSPRTGGLRAAVHHVAFEASKRGYGPVTLALEGIEAIPVGDGEGPLVGGDAVEFVLVGTGRKPGEPGAFGGVPNIYAD